MSWKPLKFLLSTSLLVVAFGYHNEVNAELVTRANTKEYGTFYFEKTLPSLHTYAMSTNSNTEFAVAIMTPNQIKDDKKTGIRYPSVMWINCKAGRMRINTMKKPPAQDAAKVLTENMQFQGLRFCKLHQQEWKHSLW